MLGDGSGTRSRAGRLEQARRIHSACEAFESRLARWHRRESKMSSNRAAEAGSTGLLRKSCLMLEIELRREGGEGPSLAEDTRAIPREADRYVSKAPFAQADGCTPRAIASETVTLVDRSADARARVQLQAQFGRSASMSSSKRSHAGAWGSSTRPGSGEPTGWSRSR